MDSSAHQLLKRVHQAKLKLRISDNCLYQMVLVVCSPTAYNRLSPA